MPDIARLYPNSGVYNIGDDGVASVWKEEGAEYVAYIGEQSLAEFTGLAGSGCEASLGQLAFKLSHPPTKAIDLV
jgi:hypothetical protein